MYNESFGFQQLNEPAIKIEESFSKPSEGILTSNLTEAGYPKEKLKLRMRNNKHDNNLNEPFIITPNLIVNQLILSSFGDREMHSL